MCWNDDVDKRVSVAILARTSACVGTAETGQPLDTELIVKCHEKSVNAFSGFDFVISFFFPLSSYLQLQQIDY